MLSGGGIEFDGGRKWYRWSNSIGSSSASPGNISLFDGSRMTRAYSIPDLLRTRNTTGIVEAVIYNDHNPFDPCIDVANHPQTATKQNPNPDNTPKDTIVFHSGSHNSGGSWVEGREAVVQIIRRFEKWVNDTAEAPRQNSKCLVIVATNDCYHETISAVKDGKFGNQQHFRNSWRIASLNRELRNAVIDAKRKRRDNSEEPLNVHFLDPFHMSLGVHWIGHFTQPADPVHFINNAAFADLAFEAVRDLCDS